MSRVGGQEVSNSERSDRRPSSHPFLRIPPFPGRRINDFSRSRRHSDRAETVSIAVLDLLRTERVGGSYWAAQPKVPRKAVIVRQAEAVAAARRAFPESPIVLWADDSGSPQPAGEVTIVAGECDPWHMMDNAEALVTRSDDDAYLIATLLDVPSYSLESDGTLGPLAQYPVDLVGTRLADEGILHSPFDESEMTLSEVIRLCGFWRRLIDSNRGLRVGTGFAFWKQDAVAPLLWGGSTAIAFARQVAPDETGPIAVWSAKTDPALLRRLQQRAVPLIEVEDGFLRSRGLGADCVPPLSITVDRVGAYFDPARPSELEQLIEQSVFDEEIIGRAERLREEIVAQGLGKYDRDTSVLDRPAGSRRHILVPGQVEDDRSVIAGGQGLHSNLDLLARARAAAPDAFIVYKPHPDVMAGHRQGEIPDDIALVHADEIAKNTSIASLLAMVDEVHVNTSLAGFEALLRGKTVVTHGVPFYAGWGLTEDLGRVPDRRTARRSIDELVAATLLLYPRYLDPVSGLPCPAEVAVDRLTAEHRDDVGPVVHLRRLQGRLKKWLAGARS